MDAAPEVLEGALVVAFLGAVGIAGGGGGHKMQGMVKAESEAGRRGGMGDLFIRDPLLIITCRNTSRTDA